MYLKRLYTHHKGWLLFVVTFVAAQLFITFKAGITVTPLLYYGMYSRPMPVQEVYPVINIYVNGEQLRTGDFSTLGWYTIIQPVIGFEEHQQNNREWWKRDISRLLHTTDSTKYLNAVDPETFRKWYRIYLESKLGYPVRSVDIEHATYIYNRYGFNKNLNPLPNLE